jgi:AmiR/NasT family two-component response regulator
MQSQKLTEAQAFARLQMQARRQRRPMRQIAEEILGAGAKNAAGEGPAPRVG